MKFRVLVENKTNSSTAMAEHGLCIYIESHGRKILFDSGASDLFLKNAVTMGVDIKEVDTAVVSHGHYDHTGGFPAFCRVNHKAPVYIHKNAFRKSYVWRNNELGKITSGIRWSERELEEIKPRLIYTDGPEDLNENIRLTGTVRQEEAFIPTERFYYIDDEGELVEDDMSHEQCLVIREPKGLYIFSGCSHRGAVAALNAGKSMFPGEKVAVFLAGMHLYSASKEDRYRVIEEIAAENLDMVMPVHCTGIEGICALKNRLGDRCEAVAAGYTYHDGR